MNEMISIWKSQWSTNGHEQYSIQDFNQIYKTVNTWSTKSINADAEYLFGWFILVLWKEFKQTRASRMSYKDGLPQKLPYYLITMCKQGSS